MNKTMIFHHPYPLFKEGESGSQVRPFKMFRAFEAIGYEVKLVAGYGHKRKQAIKSIINDIRKGQKIDFVYSESSTMPTLLTEKKHFPKYPFLDFGFFNMVKSYQIPIGLFYRDIYWRYSLYKKQVSIKKRMISIPMYWYDWVRYKSLVDHLFLPSISMAKYLPSAWDPGKFSALPPGCEVINHTKIARSNGLLRLLYIGGCTPPTYNLIPMFKAFEKMKGIHLVLCCRHDEWDNVKELYSPFLTPNINILHLNGERLNELYDDADVFVILREKDEYLDFAMPVKIFEALGHGLPIITLKGSEGSRFISNNSIGWVLNDMPAVTILLEQLRQDKREIYEMKELLEVKRNEHTWDARAEQVSKTLLSVYY